MACRICVTSLMKSDYSPRRKGQQDPADASSCLMKDRMRVTSLMRSSITAAGVTGQHEG